MSSSSNSEPRAHWGSRLGFILAAAGSAVGLGNIWKFPYITGVNGGGAFVLVYLGCIALVGIPIFIAELYIGQHAQKNAVEAFEFLDKKGTWWRFPGLLGLASAFVILSFYSVVAGWVLDFEFKSLMNQFAGQSDEQIKSMMGSLFSDPIRQIGWHALFMVGTVGIVIGGIQKGIERWSRILMPALFALLFLLLIRVVASPGFVPALKFLFSPDASKLHAAGVLEAVGHAFFTLSLGMGAMITYGSYLEKKEQLVNTALVIAAMDTLIALVSGIVIFSVVFSFGLEADKGPVLMFQTLPMLFSKMSGGYLIANGFFLLVAFAAFTSAVSLLEVVITYWVETHGVDRTKATLLFGGVIFLFGIPSALSFNVLAEYKVFGLTFFDVMDKLASSIFLPVGGMFISMFYGWFLGPQACAATVGKPVAHVLTLGLLWSARIVAPAGVLVVLIYTLWP